MLTTFLALALYICSFAIPASGNRHGAPACVMKCWNYSQYVSSCIGDVRCLCVDGDFQSAVFQCLYSQCPTPHLGPALHHTINFCSPEEKRVQPTSTMPALLMQQSDFNKRGSRTKNYRAVSASASVIPKPRTRQSVSASAYMTYQTQRAYPAPTPALHGRRGVHDGFHAEQTPRPRHAPHDVL